jgi:CO dehydrogenase maturation factor
MESRGTIFTEKTGKDRMPTIDKAERSSLPMPGKKIAITGKGGSGKTMLTAIMTKLLAGKKDMKLLAIDADSAVNLPYALGIEVNYTVAETRRQIIEDPEVRAEIQDKNIRLVIEESVEKGNGFHLLVMGRPEGPGCYCSINDLLRYGIEHVSRQYHITLIDCEAGPEQVNRRVVNGVDILIIVTDPTIRGARVTESILGVIQRDKSIKPAHLGIVINRFKGDDGPITDITKKWGLEIYGRIPEDQSIIDYDTSGRPIIDLPDTSPSVIAIREVLNKLTLIREG